VCFLQRSARRQKEKQETKERGMNRTKTTEIITPRDDNSRVRAISIDTDGSVSILWKEPVALALSKLGDPDDLNYIPIVTRDLNIKVRPVIEGDKGEGVE
jgi:hypothetical protein